MVKCPQCGYRNKDGVIRCDDCGATLVKMPIDTGIREEKSEPLSMPVIGASPEYTRQSGQKQNAAPFNANVLAGLVLSVLCLFTYGMTIIPALIFTILGYRTAKNNDDERGMKLSRISFAILGFATFVAVGLMIIGIMAQ